MKKRRSKLQLTLIFIIISTVFITICLANTESINIGEDNISTVNEDEVILIPEDTTNNEPMTTPVPTIPQFTEQIVRVDFMEGVNPNYELYAMVTTKGDSGKIEIRDANTNKLIRTINRP